jgi:hypothetical protein
MKRDYTPIDVRCGNPRRRPKITGSAKPAVEFATAA